MGKKLNNDFVAGLKGTPVELLGKEVQVVTTIGVDNLFGGDSGQFEIMRMVIESFKVLEKDPYDMLVIEKGELFKPYEENKLEWQRVNIKIAGYRLNGNKELREDIDPIATYTHNKFKEFDKIIWAKIDDYGDKYALTFLLPEEH